MIAFITLLRREVRRILRLWRQTIVPPMITAVLYFIIFGNVIGSRVGPMANMSFIDFIAPGLIIMAVIMHSYQNTVSVVYLEKFQHSIDQLLSSPMSNHEILLALIGGGVVRGAIAGFMVFLVAECFMDTYVSHPFLMLAVGLATSFIFSLIGLLNGLWAQSFDDTAFVPTFILTPLIYLGGVFYSIHALPEFWQFFARFNPIFHLVTMFRYAFYDLPGVDLTTGIVVLSFFAIGGYALAYYLVAHTTLVRH